VFANSRVHVTGKHNDDDDDDDDNNNNNNRRQDVDVVMERGVQCVVSGTLIFLLQIMVFDY
jgi:hypothetical protein